MLKTEKDLVDSKKNTTFALTNNNLKERRIELCGSVFLFYFAWLLL